MSQTKLPKYPLDFDLVMYDEVDSTSDELRRLLAKSAQGSAQDTTSDDQKHSIIKAVMATQQTKGRGRLGRDWVSPPGGLYISLALDTTKAAQEEATLSLVIALALRSVLSEIVQQKQHGAQSAKEGLSTLQVKWPNDIICDQGKLVGILVESFQLASDKRIAIVGAGTNIVRPTRGASEAAAYLSDLTDRILDMKEIATRVLRSVQSYYQTWQAAEYTFAPFEDEYNAHLSLQAQHITIRNAQAEKVGAGVVRGVDGRGYLLLEDESGQITRISGGEVTLRHHHC